MGFSYNGKAQPPGPGELLRQAVLVLRHCPVQPLEGRIRLAGPGIDVGLPMALPGHSLGQEDLQKALVRDIALVGQGLQLFKQG